MRRAQAVTVVAITMCLCSVAAEGADRGYYPIEEMGVFEPGELEVDIDLQGAMLQVAAGAMQNEDAEGFDADMAQLVQSLHRLRVQVGEPESADPSAVGERILGAVDNLTATGWHQILKVEEDDELVVFFALESGGRINGLTGMVSDGGEEVVLINLVGDVDPVLLGRCLSKMDRFDGFGELMEMAE
jgi:hypothetical protein